MTTPEPQDGTSRVKAAGETVALLGAAVTGVYLLGGLVLALRLLSDGFSVDAVVALLGQAPRELVVSAGLVLAIGPAVLVGVGAAMYFGVRNRPAPRPPVGTPATQHATGDAGNGVAGDEASTPGATQTNADP